MSLSLGLEDFASYLSRLLKNYIPDPFESSSANPVVLKSALDRVEYCFSHIKRKYYAVDGHINFDHLNADHMAAFLWFYGNEVWLTTGEYELPTRLSYLNKIMHGLDLFYSVPMPSIFLLVHPVGTVVGRASFKDYLVIYQQCSIGSSGDEYPSLGQGTLLYAGSTLLGATLTGDNVVVGAGSLVIDSVVPSRTLVTGRHPRTKHSPLGDSVRARCFD